MIWLSSDLRFKWFWLSIDLRFKWFGCQSMCDSNDFGCLLIWTSSDVVVNWFEIQVIPLSIDLRFKWFGCQSIWDSNELVVNWFEIQVIWMSNDLRFKWFGCQLMCDSNDFVKQSFSARLPSKTKLWRSKTKHFCETSFKIEAVKLKKRSFDFLQKWNFEAQKTQLFCETSFKNETLNFEAPKRSISARLPSKMKRWSSKTKLFCETSFKNDTSTRHLTSELQYVLAIFNWMLQKYCACHEKVEPVTATRNDHCKVTHAWHEICNPSTDSASEASNIDITKREITAPATRNASFQTLFKSTTPANVFATLTNPCACHVFCNVSTSLRLPRETHFQHLSTSKNVPSTWCFNDFDLRIALARRRGANFAKLNFQKCSEPLSF